MNSEAKEERIRLWVLFSGKKQKVSVFSWKEEDDFLFIIFLFFVFQRESQESPSSIFISPFFILDRWVRDLRE